MSKRPYVKHDNPEIGAKYGLLTVLGYHGVDWVRKHSLWRVRCACSKVVVVRARSLLEGNTKSCGCLKRKPHQPERNVRICELLRSTDMSFSEIAKAVGVTKGVVAGISHRSGKS